MSLSKIVAYVTGAGQGLGRATALRLASQGNLSPIYFHHIWHSSLIQLYTGARVMVVDVSEEKAKAVAMEIGPAKGMYAVVDVTDEAKVKASVQEATKKWGTLNVAVNCAGITYRNAPLF